MRGSRTIGLVWRIKKFSKKVGVEFENQRVHMKVLLEDL